MSHSVKGDFRASKLLSCFFIKGVLCSYVKYGTVGIMDICVKCSHYERFLNDMDAEDQKVMEDIEEIRRTGVWK